MLSRLGTFVLLLLVVAAVAVNPAPASADRAGTGDQPFVHTTLAQTVQGWVRFWFTSHSEASTDYDNGGWYVSMWQHLVGTWIGNTKYGYPFGFDIVGPHIYYASSGGGSFDMTAGYFSVIASTCGSNDTCRTYRAGNRIDFQSLPVSADAEIWIDTGPTTTPRNHQDNLSPYSFP